MALKLHTVFRWEGCGLCDSLGCSQPVSGYLAPGAQPTVVTLPCSVVLVRLDQGLVIRPMCVREPECSENFKNCLKQKTTEERKKAF